jgi:hypothetical protein
MLFPLQRLSYFSNTTAPGWRKQTDHQLAKSVSGDAWV